MGSRMGSGMGTVPESCTRTLPELYWNRAETVRDVVNPSAKLDPNQYLFEPFILQALQTSVLFARAVARRSAWVLKCASAVVAITVNACQVTTRTIRGARGTGVDDARLAPAWRAAFAAASQAIRLSCVFLLLLNLFHQGGALCL